MIRDLKDRYRDSFYRKYAVYTALETELLFFMVYDIVFLSQVKQLSLDQISMITFVSLVFSLLIQYPLLKWINARGNRKAVRLGSLLFLAASLILLCSRRFLLILLGAFLKCAGHTCNAMGPALLKNHLKKDQKEDMYVSYQSDANSVTSLFMMVTALLCGVFFSVNPYLPMIACSICALAGVILSFQISSAEEGRKEIVSASEARAYAKKKGMNISVMILLAAFAIFTALTGTGLSYARMNIMKVLEGTESGVVGFLTSASVLIYLIRMLSNVFLRQLYSRIRTFAMVGVSFLLCLGLGFLYLPWLPIASSSLTAVLLFAGYLLLAFVRDPFVTVTQQISLVDTNIQEQQTILIGLNTAKKAGSMALSAIATFLLRNGTITEVIGFMFMMAVISFVLCLLILRRQLHGGQ